MRLTFGGPLLGWIVGSIVSVLMFRVDEKDYVTLVIISFCTAYGIYSIKDVDRCMLILLY